MKRMRSRRWLLALIAALTLNAALWLASPGLSLSRVLENYFLGPKMVRAEIVLKSGDVLHDYRIDAGRIRSVSSSTLTITLKERDGTTQTIEVSPTAHVKVNGTPSSFFALRRGMKATTIRDGDNPADTVLATR